MTRLPRQLVLRVLVIAVANLVLFSSFLVLTDQARRRNGAHPFSGPNRYLAAALAASLGNTTELANELVRIEQAYGAQISVFAPDGTMIGHTSRGPLLPPGIRPGREKQWKPLGTLQPGRLAMVLPLGDEGKLGTAVMVHPGELHPLLDPKILFPAVLALLTVISTLLIARWLLRPLLELSTFARELGAGNLAARLAIDAGAPMGEVAATFNETAERLQTLMAAQKELLANVSHELRTPLARIRVAMDLAAEGGAEQAAESLQEIAADLAELERLVADILTSSRLELNPSAAGPPLREAPFAARAVLEDAAARFRSRHPSCALRLELPAVDATLLGDRMLLRRALDNLLDNAVRHGGATEVELSGQALGDRLTICVRDRGAGMPAADLSRLFTPFFRGDQSRARQTGGLGLGLLLTKRIVEAHRGTIGIESAPGQGTAATVTLTLLEAARAEPRLLPLFTDKPPSPA